MDPALTEITKEGTSQTGGHEQACGTSGKEAGSRVKSRHLRRDINVIHFSPPAAPISDDFRGNCLASSGDSSSRPSALISDRH